MTDTEYYCPRCGYTITNKISFIKHLNRTNICNPIYNDISVYEIINDYSFDIDKFSNRDKSKQIFQCKFCNNKYLNKYNLDRHKLICVKNTERTEIDILKKKFNQLKIKESNKKYKINQKIKEEYINLLF
jgi:hypothetical protein